jgi:hypothetical protein
VELRLSWARDMCEISPFTFRLCLFWRNSGLVASQRLEVVSQRPKVASKHPKLRHKIIILHYTARKLVNLRIAICTVSGWNCILHNNRRRRATYSSEETVGQDRPFEFINPWIRKCNGLGMQSFTNGITSASWSIPNFEKNTPIKPNPSNQANPKRIVYLNFLMSH